MSDTRRRQHLSIHRMRVKGGGMNRRTMQEKLRMEEAGIVQLKPPKQRRGNERASLKKEWL